MRRSLALALTLALIVGCASAPDGERTVLLDARGDTLVVLPLNVTSPMPEELAAASPRVWQALEAYLRAHDAPLKTLAWASARELWLGSVERARNEPAGRAAGFDDAARLFADELARHTTFDAVVVPTIFVQGARLFGRSAAWDGAEREIDIDEGVWAGLIPEEASFAGAIQAASIHVVVLNAKGREIQQAQAGLDLLTRVRLLEETDAFGAPTWEFEERPTLFEDRDALLEGIARSLAPYLSPIPPAAVP